MERRGAVRTAGAALAVPVAALLLSGCTLSGTVTINADDTLSVDAVVTHDADTTDGPCWSLEQMVDEGLTGELVSFDAGLVSCRFAGTLQRDTQGGFTALLGRGDGRYFLAIPGRLLGQSSEDLTGIDLTLTFPGPVVEVADASIFSGRSVRWTDAAAVSSTGMLVVALDHPGIHPAWVWAGLAAVAGVALGAAGLAIVRLKAAAHLAEPDLAAWPAPSSGSDAPCPDPQDGQAGAERWEATAAGPAQGSEPEDPGMWARPD